MLERLAFHAEHAIKGVLFDCHGCGQCVLRKTALICPMRCPKGLRNGPCGGTLDGACEVHSDRRCIHVRIDVARHGAVLTTPPLLPAPDPRLFHTASVANLINGKDRPARTPLPALVTDADAVSRPVATASRLEAALKSGRFVFTTEIRTPRSPQLDRLRHDAELLASHFDALNATAFLNGNPSLPSSVAAAELARLGIEAIAQATCRDHTRTTFLGEVMACHLAGVHNLLCLTGDAGRGEPPARPVFDMDASLMLYEARHLRDTHRLHASGDEVVNHPRPFLGCAINPYTTPAEVPVRRLLQKAAAGADFIQTQIITESAVLAAFMARARSVGLHRRLFTLAGIPVVISAKALTMLSTIPGVRVDPAFRARLENAKELRAAGIAAAIELIHQVRAIEGIHGVHLMLFGTDHHALVEVREAIKTTTTCDHPQRAQRALRNPDGAETVSG